MFAPAKLSRRATTIAIAIALALAAGACDGTISIAGVDGNPIDPIDDHDASAVDASPAADGASEKPCMTSDRWVCESDGRVRCVDGVAEREMCERGCLPPATGEGDAACIAADPTWPCASSEYQGQQYWTCNPDTGELHRCDDQGPTVVRCETGCFFGPLGTDDSCRVPGESTIPMPNIDFVIEGGLFTEADVRAPVEQGVRYLLDRVAAHIDIPPGRTIPDITIYYSPSSNSYCSGIAYGDYTEIACPRGYPITGDSQNYVVNITIHEIGHIVALHLIASANVRDVCENEGLATWMAGKYWMKVQGSPVSSLRDAARGAIANARAEATMFDCVSASDGYYKVYGSFFEYLEGIPGAIYNVSTNATDKSVYTDDWHAWLTQ